MPLLAQQYTTTTITIMNKVSSTNAVKLIIEAHKEKRRNLAQALKQYQADVDGLRQNAKRSKREECERRVDQVASALRITEEHIHALDTFETKADEYIKVNTQIEELCKKRRELCSSRLIEVELKRTMQEGYCIAH